MFRRSRSGKWGVVEAFVGIVGVISAALGAMISWVLATGKERVATTMQLFHQYHSTEHHAARARVARFIDECQSTATFNDMWRDPDRAGLYEDYWQVVYFWFGLSMVADRKLLDRRLSSKLFRYQYEYWQPRLHDLALATAEEAAASGDLVPEWVPVMGSDFMPWLRMSVDAADPTPEMGVHRPPV